MDDCIIDSGTSCNVVSKEEWQRLKQIKANVPKHSKVVYGYGNKELPPLGTFTAGIYYKPDTNAHIFITDFIVVNCKGPNLISASTATSLD